MRVRGFDALDQLALIRVSGNNCIGVPRALPERGFFQVESQPCLAHLGVGAMASEAVAGQNWLHILIKINLLWSFSAFGRFLLVAARGGAEQSDSNA